MIAIHRPLTPAVFHDPEMQQAISALQVSKENDN